MQQPCDLPTLQADVSDHSTVNPNIIDNFIILYTCDTCAVILEIILSIYHVLLANPYISGNLSCRDV